MRLLFLLIIFLPGCVVHVPGIPKKTPSTTTAVSEQTRIEYDKFKKITWIETPLYLSRQGFTDTFPVEIAYRAVYNEQRQREFIQLYVKTTNTDWGFYHSATDESGHDLKFINIDNQVQNPTVGLVTTEESFALELNRDQLDRMKQKNWEIKVYGKRKSGVFKIPMQLTIGFINTLDEFESKGTGS